MPVKINKELISLPEMDAIVSELKPLEIRTFDLFLKKDSSHEQLFMGQTFIANQIGISKIYCNKIINTLKDHGLLSIKRRFNKSCYYTVSPAFKKQDIRVRYKHIFKSLQLFALSLLFIAMNYNSQENKIDKKTHNNINLIRVNKRYINSYLSTSNIGRCRKNWDQGFQKIGEVMRQESTFYPGEGGNPISAGIRALKSLKLTKWGQIKLSCFPDSVIEHADKQLLAAKNIRDPFKWFYKVCLEYCTWEKIKPDWQWSKQLEQIYAMPEHPLLIIAETIPSPTRAEKATLPNSARTIEPAKKQQFASKPEVNSEAFKLWKAPERKKINIREEYEKFQQHFDDPKFVATYQKLGLPLINPFEKEFLALSLEE